MSRKPTGYSGELTVGKTPDGLPVFDVQQLEFPSDKRACELFIASGFVEMVSKVLGPDGRVLHMTDLKQNDENAIDFSVTVDGVRADLELMEAAPLDGPYDKAPRIYNIGKYVERLRTEIQKKEQKHPSSSTKPVYLLLYVTHARFSLSALMIESMRYGFATRLLSSKPFFFTCRSWVGIGFTLQTLRKVFIPISAGTIASSSSTLLDRIIVSAHGPPNGIQVNAWNALSASQVAASWNLALNGPVKCLTPG